MDRFLFYLLRSNRHVIALREILEERPVRLDEVGWSLFEDEQEDSVSGVTALVDLAAPARPASDDQPLLPARYHVFVRAIEGVYICLYPRRELFLERRESFEIDEEKYRVFELAVCRQCGAAYLVGERTNAEDGKQIVKQPGPRSFEHPSGGGNSSCCWMAEPRRRPMTRTNWSRMMRYMPRRRPSGCDCACAAVPLTARMRCFPPAIAVPKSEFGS